MKRESFILKLYQSKSTVFTGREISLILNEQNGDILKSKISYHVKKGVIKRIRRGIFVKAEYDRLELATKIYTPSYISLETALKKEGIIFQYYKTIFVLSYLSRKLDVDNEEIQIRKIKNDVLLNPLGILKKENYAIASKERAFLDALYLYIDYHFDNLSVIDWEKAFEMVKIYKNKRLAKQLDRYFKDYKNA